MRALLLSAIILISAGDIFSQENNIIIGQNATNIGAALYDLSDPTGVNIEVNMWGTVRYPGRYRVPIKTTFLDLLSYAGGPLENSKLDDIRIYRMPSDSIFGKPEIITLNYEDMLYEENVKSNIRLNPSLRAGDVVFLLEEKRHTLRENIALYLPIVTSILSIVTLIVTLSKQ